MNKVFEGLNIDKSTWLLTKLGSLVSDVSERVSNPAESKYDKFVGLGNFVSGDIKIKSWEPTKGLTSSAKAFQAGDILFARRNAYLRRASLVDFDGCCSGDAFVLRENQDEIAPGFLAFLLNSDSLWDYANSNAAGTMSKRVKWRDLANYEFLLPPKSEQARLAELLWAMDEVIEKEKEVLENINRTDLSYLKQYFYDDESTKRIKLKNIVTIKKGKKPSVLLDKGEGLPYCTAKYLRTGEIESIVPEEAWAKAVKINETDIIVLWDGSNAGEMLLGKLGFLASTMCKLDLKDDSFLKNFVYHFLRFKTKDIKRATVGSAIPHVDPGMIENIEIPLFDIEKQRLVVELFKAINSNIASLDIKISSSQSLQKSLINQIF